MEDLDCDVHGGMPFLSYNNIKLDIPNNQVHIGETVIRYRFHCLRSSTKMRRVVVRSPATRVVHPGEFLEVDVPGCDSEVCKNAQLHGAVAWAAPVSIHQVNGKLRILNETVNCITLPKDQQIADASPTCEPQPRLFSPPSPVPSHPSARLVTQPYRMILLMILLIH